MNPVPYTRTSEWVKTLDGKNVFRCYSPSNPHYYYDLERDKYFPINAKAICKVKRGIGDVFLKQRNHVSMGWRKDGDPWKFIGLRPDETQLDGTEQLEFTVKSIEIDGSPQPIDLSRNLYVDPMTVSLGSIYVRSTRHFTKQLVPIKTKTDSVRIVYQLHVKGLSLIKEYPNFRFVNAAGKDRFVFIIPKVFDKDFNPIFGAQVTHDIYQTGNDLFYVKEIQGLSDFEPPYFVDADTFYGATSDGTTSYQAAVSAWSSIQSGYPANVVDYSLTTGVGSDIYWYGSTGNNSYLTRGWFAFDTSALPDELDISAVDLAIYVVNDYSGDMTIFKSNHAIPLATSSHQSYTGSSLGSIGSGTGWKTVSFVTPFSMISPTGITKFCSRNYAYDVATFTPTVGVSFYKNIRYADYTGTTYDPYLSITYELPRLNGRIFEVM